MIFDQQYSILYYKRRHRVQPMRIEQGIWNKELGLFKTFYKNQSHISFFSSSDVELCKAVLTEELKMLPSR